MKGEKQEMNYDKGYFKDLEKMKSAASITLGVEGFELGKNSPVHIQQKCPFWTTFFTYQFAHLLNLIIVCIIYVGFSPGLQIKIIRTIFPCTFLRVKVLFYKGT